MLNPSKSGWIKKYLSLLDENFFASNALANKKQVDQQEIIEILAKSGIIFGLFGNFIFLKNQEESQWTFAEKLKVLYFESLLLVYLHHNENRFNQQDFLEHLERFYELTSSRETKKIWSVARWFNLPKNIEKTISVRTQIPLHVNSNFLVSYLQNSLCYIDIILFEEFSKKRNDSINKDEWTKLRTEKITLTLKLLIVAFHSDGYIDESEKKLFDLFLASADIDYQEKQQFEWTISEGAHVKDLIGAKTMSPFFRNYLFQLAVFAMLSDTDFSNKERKLLNQLSILLDLSVSDITNAYDIIEKFTLEHEEIVTQLKSKTSYEQIFSRVSKKWTKILLRNKDKLTQEIQESGELVGLVRKSMTQPLSIEEKAKVKTQFIDIAKSVPSLAIFLLPGGAFILPFVLKVLPDLLPSAFRDNIVDEEETKEE